MSGQTSCGIPMAFPRMSLLAVLLVCTSFSLRTIADDSARSSEGRGEEVDRNAAETRISPRGSLSRFLDKIQKLEVGDAHEQRKERSKLPKKSLLLPAESETGTGDRIKEVRGTSGSGAHKKHGAEKRLRTRKGWLWRKKDVKDAHKHGAKDKKGRESHKGPASKRRENDEEEDKYDVAHAVPEVGTEDEPSLSDSGEKAGVDADAADMLPAVSAHISGLGMKKSGKGKLPLGRRKHEASKRNQLGRKVGRRKHPGNGRKGQARAAEGSAAARGVGRGAIRRQLLSAESTGSQKFEGSGKTSWARKIGQILNLRDCERKASSKIWEASNNGEEWEDASAVGVIGSRKELKGVAKIEGEWEGDDFLETLAWEASAGEEV